MTAKASSWLPFWRRPLSRISGGKSVSLPGQALQFAFNGLSVGAVYALLAMGFTLVYSTVWFFDLYYGAAAALGAYGVFYLRSRDVVGGRYEVNDTLVNICLPPWSLE